VSLDNSHGRLDFGKSNIDRKKGEGDGLGKIVWKHGDFLQARIDVPNSDLGKLQNSLHFCRVSTLFNPGISVGNEKAWAWPYHRTTRAREDRWFRGGNRGDRKLKMSVVFNHTLGRPNEGKGLPSAAIKTTQWYDVQGAQHIHQLLLDSEVTGHGSAGNAGDGPVIRLEFLQAFLA
jgi:hypothetical protein